MTIIYTWI